MIHVTSDAGDVNGKAWVDKLQNGISCLALLSSFPVKRLRYFAFNVWMEKKNRIYRLPGEFLFVRVVCDITQD